MNDRQQPARWPPAWQDIYDEAVLAAVARVPRHLFMPAEQQPWAYADVALPIGSGQTISQPYIVALMTQALRLEPTSRVLEVGTGSGYQAAVLSEISRDVRSVELRPELAAGAQDLLHRLGYGVSIKVGDGCLGWPEQAPYDAIIVTAAGAVVAPALVMQLAVGGRLVLPLEGREREQRLWVVEKLTDGLRRQFLAEVRFVPLITAACDPEQDDEATAQVRHQLEALFDLRE